MLRPPSHRTSIRRIPGIAAAYFGIVFGAGFLLGSVRVIFLVPRFGERVAELAEMPFMFGVIYFAAGYVVSRFRTCVGPRGWAGVGVVALSLLILAELLLAAVLTGRGVGEYIAARDPVSGGVYLGMLLVFAAMPWLRCKQADVRVSAGA